MDKTLTLRPRLAAILERASGRAADIGADHGRLSVALAESKAASKVICTDISEVSLQKARGLAEARATRNIEFRAGDGLDVIAPGEVDTVILAGMGGTLMIELLKRGEAVARGATLLLQPMRRSGELRCYLVNNGYEITYERLVRDAGRYYQIIEAKSGRAVIPDGFPPDMYELGYMLYIQKDPLLYTVTEAYIEGTRRRLKKAQQNGASPETLMRQLDGLCALKRLMEEDKDYEAD